MRIGQRRINKVFKAIFGRQHYIAFLRILVFCPMPFTFLWRYLSGKGDYPIKIKLRTLVGDVSPCLYSYQDIITINEIFFRVDYFANKEGEVVVDLGSNIGLSALYFLTRNDFSRLYLFEPDPKNIDRLKKNLHDYENRYSLTVSAVSDEKGVFDFGLEKSGRYGSLNRKSEEVIKVECLDINEALKDILDKEEKIDILKIDVEGKELVILSKICRDYLSRIKKIYVEVDSTMHLPDDFQFYPELFSFRRYGEILIFESK